MVDAFASANATSAPPSPHELNAKRVGSTCLVDAGSSIVICGVEGPTDPESGALSFPERPGLGFGLLTYRNLVFYPKDFPNKSSTQAYQALDEDLLD